MDSLSNHSKYNFVITDNSVIYDYNLLVISYLVTITDNA